MKRIQYKDLLKIERPVLLFLEFEPGPSGQGKFRILYPNGNCEYMRYDAGSHQRHSEFDTSCFVVEQVDSLQRTVNSMKYYDESFHDAKLYLVDEL